MNPRERFLAFGALAAVILVGGGTLFKYAFLDPFWAVKSQIASAEDELDKKQAELTKDAWTTRRSCAATRGWPTGSASAFPTTRTRNRS